MEPDKTLPWKRKAIFQTIIFRFYVNFAGCMGQLSPQLTITPRNTTNIG